MASNKVENKDLFGADLFIQQQKDAKKLDDQLNELEKTLLKVALAQKEILDNTDKSSLKNVEKLNDAVEELNKTEKLNEEVVKSRTKIQDVLKKKLDEESKTLEELQASLDSMKRARIALNKAEKVGDVTAKEANKQRSELNVLIKSTTKNLNAEQKVILDAISNNDDLLTNSQKLVKIYDANRKKLRILTKEYKSLVSIEGKSSKETKKLGKEIKRLTKIEREASSEVKKLSGEVEEQEETVSNSVSGWLKLAAGIASAKLSLDGVKGSLEQSAEGSENVREVTSALAGIWDQVSNVVAGAALDVVDYGKAVTESVQSGKGLIESLKETEDKFNRTKEATTDFTDKVKESIEGQVGLADSIIAFEKAIRPLEIRLTNLNTLISEQQIIAGDSTRSFNELNEAVLKGQDFQIERAGINIKIAREELSIAKERIRIANLAGGAGVALLDAETEAINKLSDAEGDLKLEILENDKEIRQIKQDRLEIDLDILIDGFDNQKTINERIIANEKETLERRAALLEQTNKLAEDSFRGQKEILEDLSKAGINIDDLLLLDATELARQIQQLEQSEIINTRTLEVIRERRIVLQDLEEAQNDLNDAQQESLDIRKDILAQEDALKKQSVGDVDADIKASEDLEEQRNQNQISSIKRRLDLVKEGSIEELRLRQELNNLLLEENERLNEKEEEARKKSLKNQQELTKSITEAISDILEKGFEQRIEAIGEALTKTGERVDQLRDKAAEGRLASEESLAFEQKKERELELQRERERKRQQRTQAFFTVLSTFQASVASGSQTPLQDTIRDVGVLRALASSFGSAFDGVDDTGGRGDVDSKGGKPWILHPHEQVYSVKDRQALGFRSRDEVKDIVRKYDSGMLNDLMAHDVSNDFMNPGAFVLNGLGGSKEIVNKLDQLNKSVKSLQQIEGSININSAKKVIEYTYRKGNNIVKESNKLFGD